MRHVEIKKYAFTECIFHGKDFYYICSFLMPTIKSITDIYLSSFDISWPIENSIKTGKTTS